MKYEAIEIYTQTEIDKAVKDNDSEKLLLMVISVALYSDDYEYAENFCIQFSNHKHFNVRGNAILGFGHIARIHRKLNEKKVKPIIKKALKDESEYVRNQAEGVVDDTKHFLKWKYEMLKSSAVYDEDPKKQLKKEAMRVTKLLKGRIIKKIRRNKMKEVVIEFKDGTRFSIDWRESYKELNLSITGSFEEEE